LFRYLIKVIWNKEIWFRRNW